MSFCQVTMCAGTGAFSSPGTPAAPNTTAITQGNRRLIIQSSCQNQKLQNRNSNRVWVAAREGGVGGKGVRGDHPEIYIWRPSEFVPTLPTQAINV